MIQHLFDKNWYYLSKKEVVNHKNSEKMYRTHLMEEDVEMYLVVIRHLKSIYIKCLADLKKQTKGIQKTMLFLFHREVNNHLLTEFSIAHHLLVFHQKTNLQCDATHIGR